MKCPACADKLAEVRSQTTVVDICVRCRGIWFDKGEFANFLRGLTKHKDTSLAISSQAKSPLLKDSPDKDKKDRLCPRCHQVMRIYYIYDFDAILDQCPQCQGVWTDRAEVPKIAGYGIEDSPLKNTIEGSMIRDQSVKDLIDLSKTTRWPTILTWFFLPKIILPLTDLNPRRKEPYMTKLIIIFCSFVFVGQMAFAPRTESLLDQFGLVPANFLSVGLFTSMFLHADFLHLISNMFFLWLFGDNVEDKFSPLGYVILFVYCGLSASLLHSLMHYGEMTPVIGASGAVSGIMGAYMFFYPHAKIKTFFLYRIVYVPAFVWLGTWFLAQLFFGVLYTSEEFGNIAWSAHIGGFLFGALAAYVNKNIDERPHASAY